MALESYSDESNIHEQFQPEKSFSLNDGLKIDKKSFQATVTDQEEEEVKDENGKEKTPRPSHSNSSSDSDPDSNSGNIHSESTSVQELRKETKQLREQVMIHHNQILIMQECLGGLLEALLKVSLEDLGLTNEDLMEPGLGNEESEGSDDDERRYSITRLGNGMDMLCCAFENGEAPEGFWEEVEKRI